MVVKFADLDCMSPPTLILRNLDGTAIQTLGYAFGVELDLNYNEVSTLSFQLPKYVDGVKTPHYDEVVGMRIVDILGVGQFQLVDPQEDDESPRCVKSCKAYSLEYEFAKKNIYLENGTYNFYNGIDAHNPDTVIGRILECMPSWSVDTIDTALVGKYRTFDDINKKVYDFIKADVQESYGCIFDFDTYTRRISVKAVGSTVPTKAVYLSQDALIKKLEVQEDSDSIVTCLDVYGEEGVDIRSVNPTGTNKIYNLDYFMTTENFSQEMIDKWHAWEAAVAAAQDEYYQITISYNMKLMEILTAQADLESLNTDLSVLENERAVVIQANSSGLTPPRSYGEVSADIAAKNGEISAKESEINSMKEEALAIDDMRIAINEDLAFSEFFSEDEILVLNRYFIEDIMEDSSFVVRNVITYDENELSSAVDTQDVEITSPYTKVVEGEETMYDFSGGDLEVSTLSSEMISATMRSTPTTIDPDSEQYYNLFGTKTESGYTVSVADGADNIPLKSYSALVSAQQDLHGYGKPWAAGKGKNLFNCPTEKTSGGVKLTPNSDGSFTLSGSASSTASMHYWVLDTPIPAGTKVTFSLNNSDINSEVGIRLISTTTSTTGTSYGTACYADAVNKKRTVSQNFNALAINVFVKSNHAAVSSITLKVQCEIGEEATAWTPYENVCPITGRTGLTAIVSPTSTASEGVMYPYDWESTAGTIYGGTLSVIDGVLTVTHGEIASYAGETLPGAWISSFDEHSAGGTPTTGAQVVYELAEPLTYNLTPNAARTTSGANRFWTDSGDYVTVVYRYGTPIYNPSSIVLTAYLNRGVVGTAGFRSGNLTISGDAVIAEGTNTVTVTVLNGRLVFTENSTEYQRHQVEYELFEYAHGVLQQHAGPTYNFSVDAVNFLSLHDYAAFQKEFTLGQRVYLNIDDEILEPYAVGVHLEYDNPTAFSINFSSSYTSFDKSFALADLLDKSVSMGKTLDYKNGMYSAFVNSGASTNVKRFMESALDVAKNAVLSSGNQAMSFDDTGLRARKWADSSHESYDPEEIWMVNNMIVFTDDGWGSAKMAIGKIFDSNLIGSYRKTLDNEQQDGKTYYTDNIGTVWDGSDPPWSKELYEASDGNVYGVAAPYLVGTILAGENLIIESTKPDGTNATFRVDGSGASLYNASFKVFNNRGQVVIDPELGIGVGKGTVLNPDIISDTGGTRDWNENAKFWVDTSGNVKFSGTLEGADGVFKGQLKVNGTDTAPNFWVKGDGSINVGPQDASGESYNFVVDSGGNVTANNGTFGGIIKAKDIQIPGNTTTGWQSILTAKDANEQATINSKVGPNYLELKGIAVKNRSNVITFQVNEDGDVTTSGAIVTSSTIRGGSVEGASFYATGQGRNSETAFYICDQYEDPNDPTAPLSPTYIDGYVPFKIGYLSFDIQSTPDAQDNAKYRMLLKSTGIYRNTFDGNPRGLSLKLESAGDIALSAGVDRPADAAANMREGAIFMGSRMCLTSASYGSSLPNTATALSGQLFFLT